MTRTSMSPVWHLHVSTFRGLSPGAQHSYAVLQAPNMAVLHTDGELYHGYGQRYGIRRVLSTEQARELNENNERWGRDFGTDWSAGESTQQFDTDEQVQAAGAAAWRHICEAGGLAGQVLLLSSGFGDAGPVQPLAGPDEVVTTLREIWEYDESETSTRWTEIREDAMRSWTMAFEALGLNDVEPEGLLNRSGYGCPKEPNPLDVCTTLLDDGTYQIKVSEPW